MGDTIARMNPYFTVRGGRGPNEAAALVSAFITSFFLFPTSDPEAEPAVRVACHGTEFERKVSKPRGASDRTFETPRASKYDPNTRLLIRQAERRHDWARR